MSAKNAGAFSSTDSEEDSTETIEIPVEEYESLHERLDSLELIVEALRKKVNHQEKTDQIHETRLDSQNKAIEELEESSSDDNPTTEAEETTSETAIERLLKDPDTSGVRITASVQRALSIVGHFREWSEKVQAGRVIKGGLRKLVSTATNEKLTWKQIYRACRKLQELSNGALLFEKHRRHGWMVVLDKPDVLARVVSEG